MAITDKIGETYRGYEGMIELPTLSNTVEFERIKEKELSLIAFGTPWSSPCRNQHKILVNFMKRYNGIMAIALVDVEKHPGIARKENIQTVPTLIVYRKGREIKRLVGLQSLQTLHALQSSSGIKNTANRADARLLFLHNH